MLIAILSLFLLMVQPPASDSDLRGAEDLLRQHRYEEAITELEASLQQHPQSAETSWLLLARCYESVGKPEDALRTLRAGLRANPNSQRLSLNLGKVLFRIKPESPEAGALLAHAVEALPGDAEARYYYAQWAYLNGNEKECAANERVALTLSGFNDPALLQMYTLLGVCEDKLDHPESAESAFQKALSINRRLKSFDPSAAVIFARFLQVAAREDDALQLINEIIARSPNFGPGHLELAKHLEASGRYANAGEEAQRALSGEGNNELTTRSAQIILVKCYFALGRKKEAEAMQQLINSGQNDKRPN